MVASHGIATARAFSESEVTGSFAGPGMVLNAILTALVVPPTVRLQGLEMSRAVEELEAAAEAVSDGLESLRGEPDLAIRRDTARAIGGMIGRLDAAFSTSTAKMPGAERLVVQPFIDLAVGRAISQLLTLCEWRLERIN